MKHWYLVTNPASRKRLPQTPGAGGEAHYTGRWGKRQEPEAGVHCRSKRQGVQSGEEAQQEMAGLPGCLELLASNGQNGELNTINFKA